MTGHDAKPGYLPILSRDETKKQKPAYDIINGFKKSKIEDIQIDFALNMTMFKYLFYTDQFSG